MRVSKVAFLIPTRDRNEEIISNLSYMLENNILVENSLIIIIDNSDNILARSELKKAANEYNNKYNIEIILLESSIENNPGAVRNVGLKKLSMCDVDYIVFLDDDARIGTNNWIRFLDLFKDNSLAGFTARIIEPNKPKRFLPKEDASNVVGKIDDRGTVKGNFYVESNDIFEIDHMRGCFMVIKKSVIDRIGYFDENLTGMFFEETEYCLRIKKEGYKLIFIPFIEVSHNMAERISVVHREENRPMVMFYKIRNYVYSFVKHGLFSLNFLIGFLLEDFWIRSKSLIKNGKILSFIRLFGEFFMGIVSGFVKGIFAR